MKNCFFASLALLMLAASCNQQETDTDETSIHARADSTVGAQMQEINQRAMDDLEKRRTIEVKAKADSIVTARKSGVKGPAGDSLPMRPDLPRSTNHPAHDTARR